MKPPAHSAARARADADAELARGPLRLTLRQMQAFVAIAKAGSTIAAGEAIGASQSAVSAALLELERTLGLNVFDRSGKRLLLNDQGKALLPQARRLLDAARHMQTLASPLHQQLQDLRIGASTTIAEHLLPDLLAQVLGPSLGQVAPGWHARYAIANTATIAQQVGDFELDIGLVEGQVHDARVLAHAWLSDEMIVVAAPSYEPLQRQPGGTRNLVDLHALQQAVWLVRESGSGTREAMDQFLLPHLKSYGRCMELASSAAIRRCAALGLGLACLSRWVVEDDLAQARLVQLETPWPAWRRPCHWIVHRDKALTPAMARFVEQLRAPAALGSGKVT